MYKRSEIIWITSSLWIQFSRCPFFPSFFEYSNGTCNVQIMSHNYRDSVRITHLHRSDFLYKLATEIDIETDNGHWNSDRKWNWQYEINNEYEMTGRKNVHCKKLLTQTLALHDCIAFCWLFSSSDENCYNINAQLAKWWVDSHTKIGHNLIGAPVKILMCRHISTLLCYSCYN